MMLENAGIPVPAETALIICSFFASQGVLKIWLIIPIAILGDVIGDNIGFCIGRFGGRPLVEKYGRYVRLDRDKLNAMEALFREKGGRTVFTAHFFATTRIAAALIAGISHMHYPRFLAFNFAAAIAFICLVANITFLFGKNLDDTLRFFHMFRLAGLIVAVLLVTSFLYRFYRKKKHLYKKLGVKIVTATLAVSLLLGFAFYAISAALIVLPRTSGQAGSTHGSIGGIEFDVQQGFISSIDDKNLLITALGKPLLEFKESGQPASINVTIRNIQARRTIVQCSSLVQQPLILDNLTLFFRIALNPSRSTLVTLKSRATRDHFLFAITADTHDAGPIFTQMIESINHDAPSFLILAGDFVKHGRKRGYRTFLDQISRLTVPVYTATGFQELSAGGEKISRKLFGPYHYSFVYQNSMFIIIDTFSLPKNDDYLAWLAEEVKKGEKSQNIFLITYSVPLNDKRFTEIMSRSHIRTVYAVKAIGEYLPVIQGVPYVLLEQRSGQPFFYKVVTVKGRMIFEENVPVIPEHLTIVDKASLAIDNLATKIMSH
jgi:membrane protein DedA with SNARE-associated domain